MFNSVLFQVRLLKYAFTQVAEKICEGVYQFLLFDNADMWQCLNYISNKRSTLYGLL